jgi:prepilin-type N-terminal cleavage/methylation domain-containing protein
LSAIHEARRGFTLLELMIALLVMTVIASALAMPLAAQVQMRRYEETRRTLDEAKETLLGFAAAHGRLPCPASETSNGAEAFASGGDPSNGNCASFHDGYLPGAALGLAPLDPEGLVRDAWMGPRNRIRYAVAGGGMAINGVTNALTRTNGLQAATLPALGAASHYLFICSTGAQANGSGCGPAANQLTRRAAFVLLSLGATGAAIPAAGSDEAKNLDGDGVFVSREVSFAAGNEFDDVLLWVPVHLVTHRLLVAGRLP